MLLLGREPAMDTRSSTCRACGTHVLTSAPPVADEVLVCLRCAGLPVVDPTRPVTVCRALDAPRARRAA